MKRISFILSLLLVFVLSPLAQADVYYSDIAGDLNDDGMVDGSDVTILAGNWYSDISDLPRIQWVAKGDINGDGFIDGSDLTILAGNWQYGVPAEAADWEPPSVPGDANCDGRVDGSDVTALAQNWQFGASEGGGDVDDYFKLWVWQMGDFNIDGQINGSDVTILASNWQYGVPAETADWEPLSVPGDANCDGRVDGSDVTIVAANWSRLDSRIRIWTDGDFNGDGNVDGSDVTILAGNWQYGVTATATTVTSVPEPSMGVLLLSIAALGFLGRRCS